MNEKIREQILAVRDTGEANMLDSHAVQVIADRLGFFELVVFIQENRREYARFIITGGETE